MKSLESVQTPWKGSARCIKPLVSAFTAFACLTSLGSWMMLVGQAGVRAANDGNFPKVYGEVDSNGIPKKGLLLAAVKMTALMILITLIACLHDFARGYEFQPEKEDYLIHITTGTHVAQICWFLLAEARYLPARLIQSSPPRKKEQPREPGWHRACARQNHSALSIW